MTLLSHLGHTVPPFHAGLFRRPPRTPRRRPLQGLIRRDAPERLDVDPKVFAVQRLGAVGVGLFLLVFGVLGATGGVGLLAPDGGRYLGMSSDGLLAALSIAVAVVLVGAACRSPRTASTTMLVLGALFLLSALVNLGLIGTAVNLLAFDMADVVFSVGVGLLLLVLGAYGRISGNLPDSSPYAHPHAVADDPPELPSTPEEVAAEAAMREAEIAVVQHYATEDQRRRVQAMAGARTRAERRRTWLELDRVAMTGPVLSAARGTVGGHAPRRAEKTDVPRRPTGPSAGVVDR